MENATQTPEEHTSESENTLKNKDKIRASRKSSLDFRKYTKQIWLAGLGAFSRAEEEGNKLFDSLVKVGEELESKTTEIADQTVEKVSQKAKESVIDTKDQGERLIDHSGNDSLNRIVLVTAKDLQHLEHLVLQFHAKVDALIEENKQLKEDVAKSKRV